MALLNLDDDPWVVEFESCERLQRNIMEQLANRGKESKTSEIYSRLSASIRLRLKQYDSEVSQLKLKLDDTTKARTITYDEMERRLRQVDLLKSASIRMHKDFDDATVVNQRERMQLLGGPGSSVWNAGGPDDQMLGAVGVNYQSLDQYNADKSRMLEEQERGLENLSKIISRQKEIANTINTEVDLHNDILDDLGDQIDRTDTRIRQETDHIAVVDRKDKTFVYWVAIVLLFISIIVVVAI